MRPHNSIGDAMQWYWVTIQNGQWSHKVSVQAADTEQAKVNAVAGTNKTPPNNWVAIKVRADRQHDARETRVAYWRNVWRRALANMPAISTAQRTLGMYGQQSALGYCLYNTKHVHLTVFTGWRDGAKPKGVRAQQLEKLAGKYGTVLARVKLKAVVHKYHHWPA